MRKLQPRSALSQRLLQQSQDLPHRRLTQISFQDKSYFVKMPEQHVSLRWRLQKGDPNTAFAREVVLLRGFAAKGAPVPKIVAEDGGRIVLADHGKPLQWLVHRGQADAVLMQHVGQALAKLHALGLAHGRPSLRDICWDGNDLTFLDLEAGAKLQANAQDQARDLFLLLHSVFLTDGTSSPLAEPVLAAYRSASGPAVWTATQKRSRRLWWLEWMSRPGAWLHRIRGKTRCEFAAIRAARALIARA